MIPEEWNQPLEDVLGKRLKLEWDYEQVRSLPFVARENRVKERTWRTIVALLLAPAFDLSVGLAKTRSLPSGGSQVGVQIWGDEQIFRPLRSSFDPLEVVRMC